MYDLARAIQEDRWHRADIRRAASDRSKERSISVGRYRVTVTRRSGTAQPAA